MSSKPNRSGIKFTSVLLASIPFACVISLFLAFVYGNFYSFVGKETYSPDVTVRGPYGDSFGPLTSLFSGLGFAGVVVTLILQRQQLNRREDEWHAEVEERRSLFNLDAAKRAYKQAIELLSDQVNDRDLWYRAARLVEQANHLARDITVTNHKIDLEISQVEYRAFFEDLFNGKSASYFYGGYDGESLDEAARLSSVSISSGGHSALEESSMHILWMAAQWPDEFEYITEKALAEYNWEQGMTKPPGFSAFLAHAKVFVSEKGIVKKRTSPEGYSNWPRDH